MEPLDKADRFMDDLLDFASDIGDDEDDDKPTKPLSPSSSSFNRKRPDPASFNFLCPDDPARSFPDFVEEELEWLSNKDAFPAIESFVDIIPDHPSSVLKQQSPISVLENSTSSSNNSNNSTNTTGSIIMSCCGSLKVPVRARSKHRRKRRRCGFPDLSIQQSCWSQTNNKVAKSETNIIGRKCQHCGAEKTPQWRAGPQGPKTLCNACGVRYKSGRLVAEYRPASSPSFSSKMHSNSHRKIMEMRKQKMAGVVIKNMDKG